MSGDTGSERTLEINAAQCTIEEQRDGGIKWEQKGCKGLQVQEHPAGTSNDSDQCDSIKRF